MHTILTADGSESMRQMVSFTLKNASFTLIEAIHGEDAWEKAQTHNFDLLLSEQNFHFGQMDGLRLTRMLRQDSRFKTKPILILTTESSDEMKQRGRAAGATGWLVKPFDPARLIEIINKVIR